MDMLTAIRMNFPSPFAIGTALALNEIIDNVYGERAKLLKRHVYSQEWYRLPIGVDMARTMLGSVNPWQ